MASRQNYNSSDIAALLPKFGDLDPDIRYMSLVDLSNILDAGSTTLLFNDSTIAARIVDCLLTSLDDTNGDVQSQALKSIGPLVHRSPPDILCQFLEKLTMVKTTKSMDSSIPATAARTMITALPRPTIGVEPSKLVKEAYSAISKVLVPRLLGYIVVPHGIKGLPNPPHGMLDLDPERGADVDSIDLLHETIRCFGPMLQDVEKQALLKRLAEILDDQHTGNVAKKKTVAAVSVLAVYMSDMLLSAFVSSTINSFQAAQLTPGKRRLLISMMGSIARSIPRRLGPFISTLTPYILEPLNTQDYSEDLDEDTSLDQAIEDVKEAALSTLNDFLASCANNMRPYTEPVLRSSLRYLAYDPALALNEEDEHMSGTRSDDGDDSTSLDEGDDDFEQEGTLSDVDDSSWKIRRCATKVLYTMISTRGAGDLLEDGTLYDKVAPVLIKCFQEREENVRLEILETLTALIRKTGGSFSVSTTFVGDGGSATAAHATNSRKRRRGGSDASMFDNQVPLSSKDMTSPGQSPSPTSGPRADLARLGPSILRGIVKLLKQVSVPTKQAATTLLRAFVLVRHGGLTDHLSQVTDSMMDSIKTASAFVGAHSVLSAGGTASATGNSLRLESLQLLRAICDTHSSKVITPFMDRIIPCLVMAVNDRYSKVSGEAMGVSESVVKVITPPRGSGAGEKVKRYIENLFDAVIDKVRMNEIDLEVRQSAIQALGVILAQTSRPRASKLLPATKRSKGLATLLERLRNETTRKSSVRAIDNLSVSPMDMDDLTAEWVKDVALELAQQLRKADRALRSSSLTALKHLTGNAAAVSKLDGLTIGTLVILLLPTIDANALGLLSSAMDVIADLAKQSPKQVLNDELNRALCQVVITPMAGHVLVSFLALVDSIGAQGVGQPLMQALLKDVGVVGDPGIVGSAIGALLVSGGSSVGVGIRDIVKELRTGQDDQRKCLALSILGEASLRLGPSSPLQPNDFLEHFSSRSDQVPRAAAVALGRAGASNSSLYLPKILSMIEKPGNTQLLLLHSTREVLQYASENKVDIGAYTEAIWKVLFKITESEDNKAVGAECVGRLISIEPEKYLPLLQNHLQAALPSVRGMVIQAVRFALTDADEAFDEVLKPILVGMLSAMLNDPELENRRLALITLNSATQNKGALILPHLSQLLPPVIKESNINPALIREVQMGPFKHKVDDGLEIRKSAYETLHALMNTAFSRMNPCDLFDRVVAGLQDDHDIQMLCNLMLTKLALMDPEETVRRLDSIAERFQAILSTKLKDNAVKQEVEKAQEVRTDVLRATVRLQAALQSASSSIGPSPTPVWRSYWEFVGKEFKMQLHAAESVVKHQR